MEDHESGAEISNFLTAAPIETAHYPELLQSYQSRASMPALLANFFRQAIDNGDIGPDISADDLVVLLGGTTGMSLFQRSTGIGNVSSAARTFAGRTDLLKRGSIRCGKVYAPSIAVLLLTRSYLRRARRV